MLEVRLSVTVITYNQVNYIGDCLKSILSQKVDFPFEIVMADDASTDGTLEFIKEYCEKHDNIFLIAQPKNVGLNRNYLDVIKACKGKFIAHIDGDDLMLPGKLQKQVDVLNARPDVAVVHHPVLFVDENNTETGRSKRSSKTVEDINDLCINNKINNSSNMYRATATDAEFFKIPDDLVFHDWYFHLLKVQSGKIYFIDEYLGCYRKHAGSVINSSRRQRVLKTELNTLNMAKTLKGVSEKSIRIGYSEIYLRQARHYLRNRQLIKVAYFLHKVKCNYPYSYRYLRYWIKLRIYNFMRAYSNG